MIKVSKKNEVYLRIEADEATINDIGNHFSFKIPGYQHMSAFKDSKGKWDGSIKLFSPFKKELYYGHIGELAKFASRNKIELGIQPKLFQFNNYDEAYIHDLLNKANLPSKFERRPYQIKAALEAINYKRLIIESPTASGKSFIVYMFLLHLLSQHDQNKIAIIVPRTSLVEQMYSDFEDYGMDVEALCGRIYAKYKDNYPKKKIYITTWQSISKMEEGYFHMFDSIIGDEAHGFKAKMLRHIMDNTINASYRIGLTGTVPDKENERLLVEGLFGPKFEGETTVSLIEKGYLNDMLPIEVHVLKYSDEECKVMKGSKYQDEISFYLEHEKRNNYLKDLAINQTGNTLLLFERVEKHGKPLYNIIKENTDKKVFYVSGEVKTHDREYIRKLVKDENDCIIVASMGTFSTGVNIPNLDNLILAMTTKSHIAILQMIGRVLRKSKNKTKIFDVVDNLCSGNYKNYAMNHAIERIKIYCKKEFKYTMKTINL